MSEIEIIDDNFMTSGLGVHFGCADVGACFHRLRLRGKVCEYFCWEPIEAKWLGQVAIEGARVPASHLVYPTQIFTSDGFQLGHLFCPVSLLQITS